MRTRAARPPAKVGRAQVRKLAGLMMLILMALLLAACGSDDDNGDATEEATTVADIATEATTEEATETETVEATEEIVEEVVESSPAAVEPSGMASPAVSVPATPVGASSASPVAIATSPAAITASPVAATPAADTAIVPVADTADDVGATPAATEVALTGRVELEGAPNEAWVMTSEGCVGLGANTSLKPGQQLVVRDAEGAIVGVTMLAASDETDACSWDFSVTVSESPFYEVSVPMAVEHIFTRDEVEQSNGELVVPAA